MDRPEFGELHDPSVAVRSSAADALGHLGDAQAVDALFKYVDSKHAVVRESALDAYWACRGKAVDEHVMEKAKDSSAKVAERLAATWALQYLAGGADRRKLLHALMEDEEWKVRWAAAVVAGRTDPKGLRSALLAQVEDDKSQIRAAATRGLVSAWSQADSLAMVKAMKDSDPMVRFYGCLGVRHTWGAGEDSEKGGR